LTIVLFDGVANNSYQSSSNKGGHYESHKAFFSQPAVIKLFHNSPLLITFFVCYLVRRTCHGGQGELYRQDRRSAWCR
jgi:hypothetical protein